MKNNKETILNNDSAMVMLSVAVIILISLFALVVII